MQLRGRQQPLKPKEGEEDEEEAELATLVSEAAEIVTAMGKAAAFVYFRRFFPPTKLCCKRGSSSVCETCYLTVEHSCFAAVELLQLSEQPTPSRS